MHLFALWLIFLHPYNSFFFHYFVAQCHDGYVKWVRLKRLCKSFLFALLVFLRVFFGSDVLSFCYAFCGFFDSWNVCFCFLFASWKSSLCWLLLLFWSAAVLLRCCYLVFFSNEELCLFYHKWCVLVWNVMFLLLFWMLAVVSTPENEKHFCSSISAIMTMMITWQRWQLQHALQLR